MVIFNFFISSTGRQIFKMNKRIFICAPLVLALSGCANLGENVGKIGGTAIGTAGGAAIGKEVGGDKGMVIGAVVGGVIGYFVGDYIDERRAQQKKVSQVYNVEITQEDVKIDGKRGDKVSITTSESQFAANQSVLNPQASEYFSQMARTYKGGSQKILVVGHTDDSGSSTKNQLLSEARAKTVGQIFTENGVDAKNIYYLGAGETNPVADNNKEQGRAKNRRVEIIELQSEADIVKYAQENNSNPAFFTKIPKSGQEKFSDERKQDVLASQISKTEPTQGKNSAVKEKTKMAKSSKKTEVKKNEKASALAVKSGVFIDFGGRPRSGDSFMLEDRYGGKEDIGFSLITKAYADNFTFNCTADEYRENGALKKLDGGEIIYKTTDHKKALNGGAWDTVLNNNRLGIGPISVLKDGEADKNPQIFIYKDAINKKTADFKIEGRVNTYRGKNGLLYRVFAQDDGSPIKCLDIVFDNNDASKASGYVYYFASSGNLMEKDFNIKPLRRE